MGGCPALHGGGWTCNRPALRPPPLTLAPSNACQATSGIWRPMLAGMKGTRQRLMKARLYAPCIC